MKVVYSSSERFMNEMIAAMIGKMPAFTIDIARQTFC
jgi:hypothetical protein